MVPPLKKKLGRPFKIKPVEVVQPPATSIDKTSLTKGKKTIPLKDKVQAVAPSPIPTPPKIIEIAEEVKRKRGRPPKKTLIVRPMIEEQKSD